jgi:hypothetical protein
VVSGPEEIKKYLQSLDVPPKRWPPAGHRADIGESVYGKILDDAIRVALL